MKTLLAVTLAGVDLVFSLVDWVERRFNSSMREAEEKERFRRQWTDGTDHG